MSSHAIDARPFLRASTSSLWAKAEASADEFVATIKDELARQNINAAVTRSPNGTHPVVVRMDAWIPPDRSSGLGRTVRRISLTVTCRIFPFNRSKFVHDVGLSRDGREKGISGLLKFSKEETREWVRYALGIGGNPRSGENMHIAFVSMIGLAMLSPRHNPLDKQFRNGFPPPIPVMLFWLGVLALGYGAVMAQTPSDPYSSYSQGYYPPSPYAEPAPAAEPYPETPAADPYGYAEPAAPAEPYPYETPAAPADDYWTDAPAAPAAEPYSYEEPAAAPTDSYPYDAPVTEAAPAYEEAQPAYPDPYSDPYANQYYGSSGMNPAAILAFIGGGALIILAAIISARRRKLVTVLDKPPLEPRFPRLVDAWNAVVPRLGDQRNIIRSRLFDAVRSKPVDRMQASLETYAYFGADGYIEREQLVMRMGQALVHMHVYSFEDELFVGWDSNLNQVRWIESAPQSTRVEDGMLNQFCSLEAGYYEVNEYDIVDLNVVTELVHRRLKDELLKIMKERSIEEEIDFTIVRGERDGLVKKEDKSSEQSSGGVLQRTVRRFQRQR